jgi:hypothetical protein
MIISAIVLALVLGAFIFLILPPWMACGFGRHLRAPDRARLRRLRRAARPSQAISAGVARCADAQLVSAVPVENEAIYVWLMPEASESCAYVLPWSLRAAQQLQEAMSQAEADGTAVRMSVPLESSLEDREPMFHAMPQLAMPPKDYQPGNPLVHRQPDKTS